MPKPKKMGKLKLSDTLTIFYYMILLYRINMYMYSAVLKIYMII